MNDPFNQDLQHQPETLSPKVDTVKIKAIENRNIDNDCPPTSENSILRIKPYLCNSCSKRYATPFTLKRHWNNKHGPNQPKTTPLSKKNVKDQIKYNTKSEQELSSNVQVHHSNFRYGTDMLITPKSP